MNCFATRALKTCLALAWPLLVFATPSLASPGIVFSEDFEDGVYDGLVVEVGSAEIGPGLNGSQFGLLSPAAGGDGTRIRIDLLRVTDFSVEADFRIESTVNGDFNIFLNSSENNFVDGYRGNVNPVNGDNTDALLRIAASNGQVVDGRLQTVQLGETHRLRMERVGSSVTVLLDGVEYLAYTDPNPLSGARMGLIAGIGRTTLDNVVVRDLASSGDADCNENGIADADDIANCDGSAWCDDCNENGILDECDILPTLPMFGDRVDVSVVDIPNGIAVADFNKDGLLDLVVGADWGLNVTVYNGLSPTSFGAGTNYPLSGEAHASFAVGYFDDYNEPNPEDRWLDLATPDYRSNTVSLLFGDSGGEFEGERAYEVGSAPGHVAAADFDGDHILDLAVPTGGPRAVAVLKGSADGEFSAIATALVQERPQGIAVGYFDNNDIPDLVVGNGGSESVTVLLGDGHGQFPNPQHYLIGPGPDPYNDVFVAVADFDGDGFDDIAATVSRQDRVVVLYGQGDGTFDTANRRHDVPIGTGGEGIKTADLNRDGHPDLVVANYLRNSVVVLVGDAGGMFSTTLEFPVGAYPLQLAVNDFDHDGWSDIAVTCYSADTVTILFNQSASLSQDCDTNGEPDECQPDCDHDGTPDVCELPPLGDSADCNDNGVPDACDVTNCDGSTWCDDCNRNGIPDGCDSAATGWRNVTPSDPAQSPPPRGGMGLAYDASRGVAVMFGGWTDDPSSTYLGDTWEWNGQTWSLVAPEDPTGMNAPSPRQNTAMAYDPVSERVILFGGTDSNYPAFLLGDTWTWDGTSWQWGASCDIPGVTAPAGRVPAGFALDLTGKLVLFGGQGGTGSTFHNDTWRWSGSGWAQLYPATSPPGRASAAMAFDSTRGETVLHGGVTWFAQPAHDTWWWDGTDWHDCTPPPGSPYPPSPSSPAMAHDPSAGFTVLFGGDAGTNYPPDFGETWTWDGAAWSQLVSTPSPSSRSQAGMVYDEARHALVLFGGFHTLWPSSNGYDKFADTWSFNAAYDCDANGQPDECQSDCDNDGTPDVCELPPLGTGFDCNQNGLPDSCELSGNDCDANGVPDECQADCDDDGTPDVCELAPIGTSPDCNQNGIPDECDLASEFSLDCNEDGVPDECDAPAATRDLSEPREFYCDEWVKTVRVAIAPPAGALAISVEDAPPAGWNAIDSISDGGWYDAVNHKVKWGPFFAPFPSFVSYDIQPPLGTTDDACFGPGVASVDGLNEAICGVSCIEHSCCPFAPADDVRESCNGCADCGDGCQDGRVVMNEVVGYACAWKRGCNDDIGGMTRSAYIWRAGECYCWSDDAQNWMAHACTSPASGCCNGGVAAAVEAPPVADVSMDVEPLDRAGASRRPAVAKPHDGIRADRRFVISAIPPDGTQALAAEVEVPKGWTVQTIGQGGAWDDAHRKVKWGPFFGDASMVLTFEAKPARETAANGKFRGTVSCDGTSTEFSGR